MEPPDRDNSLPIDPPGTYLYDLNAQLSKRAVGTNMEIRNNLDHRYNFSSILLPSPSKRDDSRKDATDIISKSSCADRRHIDGNESEKSLPLKPECDNKKKVFYQDNVIIRDFSKSISHENKDNNAVPRVSSKNTTQEEKKVAFGFLEMRKYPVTLGDHPECCQGAPVTIDWDYIAQSRMSLEEYESIRGPRRHMENLQMAWLTRKRILQEFGFSEVEIRKAISEVKRIQKQRSKTISSLRYQKLEELSFHFFRKVGRGFSFKRSSFGEEEIVPFV